MRPGFHHKLLNGYFEDPCLYVRIPWEKRVFQFDLGDIRNLSVSEIYRITDVFITHMHVDHFIGFDALLRIVLKRDLPLNVYGPPGIIKCVEGKLKGYTWNLIADYPTVINVFAFDGRTLSHSSFKAGNRFKRVVGGRQKSSGTLLENPLFKVSAVKLDHGVPCLAYSIEEGVHINIDKDRLSRMGLSVGPWLTEFKRMLREGPEGDQTFFVEGKLYAMEELAVMARITKGQKISYATDIGLHERNLEKLIRFVRDSDVFYCEAYFLEKDRARALERFHLTAKTSGVIARKAGVKKLVLMHFSPKYSECPELVINEAMEAFHSE